MPEPAEALPAVEIERETVSRWEDYIDVFFSPSELFARRARDRVAPPLLTLLLLAFVFYFVLLPANGMIMRASVGDNPQTIEAMNRYGTVMQVVGSIAVPMTYLVVLASGAALLWLVGRFADIRTDFSRTMLVVTYAGFVYLLAQIAGGISVILHGGVDLDIVRDMSFGVLRFVGDSDMNQALVALLRRFEIFALWQAVLWAIGIRVIYDVSGTRAGVVACVTWALLAVPGLIMGAFGLGGPPQS
ncbi:MAG: Yip1 family protein [Gemmatimonadota bacterium]